MSEWIVTSWANIGYVAATSAAMYVGLIVLTRLGGLRSFSKMSSFDFAVTVAIGSVLASSVVTKEPALLQALAALTTLYILQIGLAAARERWGPVATAVDNQPLLLMAGPTILQDNLRLAKVTQADLRAKLREANVMSYEQVHAVVFEATGDISVLHAEPGAELDPSLLEGVQGVERLS